MIEKIRELPHLPQLTLELLRDAFEDDPDIRKLAATIERDPAFTAKLFRTVNSAAYGCKAKVTSVAQAVSFLGLDTLRTIIAAIALGEYLLKGDLGRAVDVKRLCLHSLAAAVIMREVGRKLGSKKTDRLYLLGLLHDLGILALDSMDGSDYGQVLERVGKGVPLIQAERKVFATDNLVVWELLAEAWGFPEEIILIREEPIGDAPEPRVFELTAYACRTADALGYAFLPFNRNGVLFPRTINGNYALLSRPSDSGHTPFGDIYYSESPDLTYWGKHRHVMSPMDNSWQFTKIGGGPAPIETSEGWLLIYHGVLNSCNGFVYSAGVALLDIDQPWKVIARAKPYILNPREYYECVGDVPNVVFPCATLCDADTGRLAIYYGAADTVVAMAFAFVDELVDFIKSNPWRQNDFGR